MRPITFLRAFLRTLTEPKYYLDVLNVGFSFSLRFLLMSYAVFSLVSGLIFGLVEVPKVAALLHPYIDQQISAFPETGYIEWNGLRLSSTLEQPYQIPFPPLPQASSAPKNLLTVDPALVKTEDIAQSDHRSSLILIGQTQAFVSQLDGTWSPISLSELIEPSSVRIDRTTVLASAQMLHRYTQQILRAVSLAFPFFFFIATLLFRVLNVVLDTILIYICLRLVQLPVTFKKTFQISLHIMVAAELISLLTASFRGELQMFSIAFWLYSVMVYWQLRKVQLLPSGMRA